MSDIQNISIVSTQTVTSPKPHTTYTIQVSTPTRSWTVMRRYNDFVSLHAELLSSAGKEPPAALPPKHPWSITRSAYDQKIIRERRVLLETYLRAILNHRDARWRQSYTFSDFLAVPAAASSSQTDSSAPTHWTASNWMTEHGNLQTILRSTRSSLLKRDALANMGDAAGSRGAGVEAKKLLREVGDRVETLERGLKEIEKGLGEGEKRRRQEMLDGIRVERGDLQRMAEAGVRTNRDTGGGSSSSPAASAFGGGAGGGPRATMPGGLPGMSPWGNATLAPQGRVFGQRPQETEETRPLDEQGLLQLQQTKMDDQDGQLEVLSGLLRKQRNMGEEIHKEIGEQTEILEEIDGEVTRVGGKMARAKRQMNKLN